MLDSLLYGLIFARGKNLLVAWLAHFLADLLAIVFILRL
jgi:membrane protease YdiL (CAAX protease family)